MAVKLLIADDEDMIRRGMEKYIRLHTERFSQIYTAKNGQEALDIIFHSRPEILLLDVHMPGKSGIDVMKEAKSAGILPRTVILSGYDEFRYAQQALNFGARGYLLKPCRSSEILEEILSLADELEEKSGQDTGEQTTNGARLVKRAREYMDEHYNEEMTLQRASEFLGISAGYLSTLFSQQLGIGFIEYLNHIRIDHACSYLKQNYFKTYEIAYKVGFTDEKYFTRVFKKVTGMTPSEYKKSC